MQSNTNASSTNGTDTSLLPESTITALFADIDKMDGGTFASYFTDDGVFIWGQQLAAVGKENIQQGVDGFYSTIKALAHSELQTWDGGDGETMFVHGRVDYTLHNGDEVGMPFLNKFVVRGEKIAHYHVFLDPTPLFEKMAQQSG